MDIKECYRVLELEIGASRDAVETAYCRLLERWHPDRVTPAGDPAAINEATRMVQAVNEAYQTLSKIAPATGTKPAVPAPARSKPVLSPQTFVTAPTDKPAPPRPTSAPPPRVAPPSPARPSTLPPLSENPVGPGMPPSPAAPASPPMPPPLAPPQGAGSPPSNSPPLRPASLATEEKSETSPGFWEKTRLLYDAVFPVESSRRRFGPIVLAAALLFLLLLGKCGYSSWSHRVHVPDPKKTGIVVVKSNLPDTAVELMSLRDKGEDGPATYHGSGAVPTLSGLPPGTYILTAKAEGWPEIKQDVTVGKGETTEVAVHFKSGSLRLDSVPIRALVRSGETELGHTPLVIPALPPGEHELTLEYAAWPVYRFKATITEGVETAATVRLPHGRLVVESIPTGATVLLKGQSIGQTPLTLEQIPAGIRKLTLQAKDFPPLVISVAMEDRGDVRVSRELGSGFPELDPAALLRAVWVPEDPNKLSPGVDSLGVYEPRNGIVKNLHRKRLYENWLRKTYRYSATVKAYLRDSGKVEFEQQTNALSKYRVVAELSPAARNDKDLIARLIKGATLTVYGRLVEVEESRWLGDITLEIAAAEPLH